MDQKRIEAYFEAHQQEMLEDICRLVRIRSVREPAEPGKPFGHGPWLALEEARKLLEEKGFAVRNFDHYVMDADLPGKDGKEPMLGILAHLDVVEEGRGWTMNPYEPVIKDGCIYGRGTADDKGPAIAGLYAMMAAREIEPELTRGVRLILGSAEETGSQDLDYYLAREKAPEWCFSPDADFPVINIEKGRYAPAFSAKWEAQTQLPRVKYAKGGATVNIVPQNAEALVEGVAEDVLRQACAKMAAETGVVFSVTAQEGGLLVEAEGKGSHASYPQEGKNAQTALVALLADLPLAEGKQKEMLQQLKKLFPFADYGGKAMGVYQEDAVSGPLTLAFTVLDLDESGFRGALDARLPICVDGEKFRDDVTAVLNGVGIEVPMKKVVKPHHTPEESAFVQTLLKAYEQYTGNKGECLAIGGGTYVHSIEGGVAFGCTMPGTDNRMHGADEFVVIQEIVDSAKIFTQVILDMCR